MNRQDRVATKKQHCPHNYRPSRVAALRGRQQLLALNLLGKEKPAKVGIELKRQKASRRTDYSLKVLSLSFD